MVRGTAARFLHFLVLGGLLFGVERAIAARGEGQPEQVRIGRATREHLRLELEARLGRGPMEAEEQEALERWKVDEVVYREARAQGVLETEPGARALLAERAREVFAGLELGREATGAELEALLREQRERYLLPARVELEHAFVSRRAPDARERAERIAREAGEGALAGRGERFEHGERFEEQTDEDVARVFGIAFATELARVAVGEVRVLESTSGFHAVRVTRRLEPSLPPREVLERQLRRDFERAARAEAAQRGLERLLSRYRFVEESP